MKSILMTVAAVVSIPFALSSPVLAQGIDYPNLSLPQAFRFENSTQSSFGHVLSVRIGPLELLSDLPADHPLTGEKYRIVGAFSAYQWSAGVHDPMKLTFHVSALNRQKLKALLKERPTNLDVQFNYQIFSYDPESKGFFIALKSFSFPNRGIMNKIGTELPAMKTVSLPLRGAIQKNGNQLQIAVDDASVAAGGIQTYGVRMSVAPAGFKQQDIVQSASPNGSRKLPWGFKEQ